MKSCLLHRFMKKRIEATGIILMTESVFLFYGSRVEC